MNQLIVNVQTGEQQLVPLTPQELAHLKSIEQAAAATTPPPEPTLTEKLASIGLTIDQLKEALK